MYKNGNKVAVKIVLFNLPLEENRRYNILNKIFLFKHLPAWCERREKKSL